MLLLDLDPPSLCDSSPPAGMNGSSVRVWFRVNSGLFGLRNLSWSLVHSPSSLAYKFLILCFDFCFASVAFCPTPADPERTAGQCAWTEIDRVTYVSSTLILLDAEIPSEKLEWWKFRMHPCMRLHHVSGSEYG